VSIEIDLIVGEKGYALGFEHRPHVGGMTERPSTGETPLTIHDSVACKIKLFGHAV
jgi:hypothetical protein